MVELHKILHDFRDNTSDLILKQPSPWDILHVLVPNKKLKQSGLSRYTNNDKNYPENAL